MGKKSASQAIILDHSEHSFSSKEDTSKKECTELNKTFLEKVMEEKYIFFF